jgi:ankyrin repeat protein
VNCDECATPQFLHVLLSHIKDFDAAVVQHSMHGRLNGLLYAISLSSVDTFLLLAEAGANIHFPARRQIKRTALQFATELGNREIVKYLLAKGVSPNEPPAVKSGATSLQLAAIQGYIGLASLLLDAGAQVNAEPALVYGRTAFEGATEHGRIEMMVFLVQHNADLLSNDRKQYRRAVQLARENEQPAAVQLANDLLKKVLDSQESSGPEAEDNRASPLASEFGADRSVWSVSEFLNADLDVGF